jgi:hypothetical protein
MASFVFLVGEIILERPVGLSEGVMWRSRGRDPVRASRGRDVGVCGWL